ncbi:MAG: hypothetical protein HYR64_10700 [Fimbriimonas ginsengisoli]|uniref:Outer membrane protein assembly factor BamE n=1 Tax=Fimbriimonas ginsengisoli TaxID=1005039 RepID=A0A931PWP4_FIMGI|nr:hypothetical protein [Fimbriimonas ginsengisoli]
MLAACFGCGGLGKPAVKHDPRYDIENLDRIELGMTAEQVVALCGPADSRIIEDGFEDWWYAGPDGPTVRITSGTVKMVLYHNRRHKDKVAR